MNITTITRSFMILPELAKDTFKFAKWDYGQLMHVLAALGGNPEHEGEDGDEEEFDPGIVPLSMYAAGRIALEMTMIGRTTVGNPQRFQELIQEVAEQMDSPQHAIDVALSLTGMVNALATDEDLRKFGDHILKHEASA